MRKSNLTRRRLLGHGVRVAVIGSMPALLHACTKPELHCEDVSGLSEEDLALRTQLQYRDLSPHGENKNCKRCTFYLTAKKDDCGRCTLIKGPIHPLGYCNSWAAKG